MAGPIQTVLVIAIVLVAYAMIYLAVLGYAAAAVIGIGGALFTVVSVGTAVVRIIRIGLGHDEPQSELRAAVSFPLSVIGGTSLGVGGLAGAGRVLTVVSVTLIDRLTGRDMTILQRYLIEVYNTSAIQFSMIGVSVRLQFWQAALGLIVIGGALVLASDRIAPDVEDPEIEEKVDGWQPSWMREGFGEDNDNGNGDGDDDEAKPMSESTTGVEDEARK